MFRSLVFFFQAEDGIRDIGVTGVQTCALPIYTLRFTVARPGAYRGVCTEFCGDQHARMAFDLVALEPEAFEAWRRGQAAPRSDERRVGKERSSRWSPYH